MSSITEQFIQTEQRDSRWALSRAEGQFSSTEALLSGLGPRWKASSPDIPPSSRALVGCRLLERCFECSGVSGLHGPIRTEYILGCGRSLARAGQEFDLDFRDLPVGLVGQHEREALHSPVLLAHELATNYHPHSGFWRQVPLGGYPSLRSSNRKEALDRTVDQAQHDQDTCDEGHPPHQGESRVATSVCPVGLNSAPDQSGEAEKLTVTRAVDAVRFRAIRTRYEHQRGRA